jgi:prevent-host-death family protein
VATIPQRELRNNVSEVLRRAESGEEIVVTVDGRAVAALGPVPGARVPATLATLAGLPAADDAWLVEHLEQRRRDEDDAVDPWK